MGPLAMDMEDVLQTFILESQEQLVEMEHILLAAAQAPLDDEQINAVFRAAHTIKGSAGLFGLDPVVAFTHVVESVLDRVRDRSVQIDAALLALLLRCRDHMVTLIDGVAREGVASAAWVDAAGQPLMQALGAYLEAPVRADSATEGAAPTAERSTGRWQIVVRFGPDVFRDGMDPMSFLRYLGRLGAIERIDTLQDALPAAQELDPETCHLGFAIQLTSDADQATLENVFEFVSEDASLSIQPLAQALAAPPETVTASPETAQDPGLNLGEDAERLPASQERPRQARPQESASIRVDADKLDQLIDLVGELVIIAANTSVVARPAEIPELSDNLSALAGLVESVRDRALQLRMVKIGGTLNRFKRVVHDVARELGKDIRLEISGEETELDKTVVERIADPLMHLVRNAVDHGMESAELRRASGKPAMGTIGLHAYHDSGSVVIEVRDDGGGLKRQRILAKAIERGLVEPGAALTDAQIHRLIFEPGFSTSEQITNLSGRGVGMDVVKRNITDLRGTVDIDSREGAGTTVTVRLPLTLAIIKGFMVGLGSQGFIVPLDLIEECIEFPAEVRQDYVDLRGEVLPFIRLRELFEIEGPRSERQNIVVVRHGKRRAGLVVDELLGEHQTVIKPLGPMFEGLRSISGSTILANGEVGLILDVPALIAQASEASPGHALQHATAAERGRSGHTGGRNMSLL